MPSKEIAELFKKPLTKISFPKECETRVSLYNNYFLLKNKQNQKSRDQKVNKTGQPVPPTKKKKKKKKKGKGNEVGEVNVQDNVKQINADSSSTPGHIALTSPRNNPPWKSPFHVTKDEPEDPALTLPARKIEKTHKWPSLSKQGRARMTPPGGSSTPNSPKNPLQTVDLLGTLLVGKQTHEDSKRMVAVKSGEHLSNFTHYTKKIPPNELPDSIPSAGSDLTRIEALVSEMEPVPPGTESLTPEMEPLPPGTELLSPVTVPLTPEMEPLPPGTELSPGEKSLVVEMEPLPPGTELLSPSTEPLTFEMEPLPPGTELLSLGTELPSPSNEPLPPGTEDTLVAETNADSQHKYSYVYGNEKKGEKKFGNEKSVKGSTTIKDVTGGRDLSGKRGRLELAKNTETEKESGCANKLAATKIFDNRNATSIDENTTGGERNNKNDRRNANVIQSSNERRNANMIQPSNERRNTNMIQSSNTIMTSRRVTRSMQQNLGRRNDHVETQSGKMLSLLQDSVPMDISMMESETRKRKIEAPVMKKKKKKTRKDFEASRAYMRERAVEIERENEKRRQDAILPCVHFQKYGKCKFGEECRFSHNTAVVRRIECCKFYIVGACVNGDKCLYYHHEWPCKFFHTRGFCKSGDQCKFSHGEITNAEIKKAFFERIEYENSMKEMNDVVTTPSSSPTPEYTPQGERKTMEATKKPEVAMTEGKMVDEKQENRNTEFKFPSLYYELP